MNAAKIYHISESGLKERGGVNRAHLHLKRHAINWLAVELFLTVRTVLFYIIIEKF